MDVDLYVYDLSLGLAREMSMQFLGFRIDAVFHTSIVIDRKEYFYGSASGVSSCAPGSAPYGCPINIIKLGKTNHSPEAIASQLARMRHSYAGASYDLFDHNCNHFSNDFARFLVNKNIPEYITNLPRQVLNTPLGRMIQQQASIARGTPVAPAPMRELHPHEKLKLPRVCTAPQALQNQIIPDVDEPLVSLAINELLDETNSEPSCSASVLVLNICTTSFVRVYQNNEPIGMLPESLQIELAAAITEALRTSKDVEVGKNLILALARLIYRADLKGELFETCRALDAVHAIMNTGLLLPEENEELVVETLSLLGEQT